MAVTYQTQFGSLDRYEKGGVQVIDDNVKHYAFSNCFEIASKSRPYERVVFGQNQIYVLECVRAEGTSPWFTCAHDEFALVMDGEVEVHLIKLQGEQIVPDPEHNGAVLVKGGHAQGTTGEVVDVLFDGERLHRFARRRVDTASDHGTGCTLSSAIAALLGAGRPLHEAVREAGDFLHGALRHAFPLGSGRGPVDHLWRQHARYRKDEA